MVGRTRGTVEEAEKFIQDYVWNNLKEMNVMSR